MLADDAPATLSDDDYASLKKMKTKPKPAVGFTATSTHMPTTAVGSTPTSQPTTAPELRNRKATREGQRSELFGATATATGAKHKANLAKATEVVGTEALLDMQRSEQENITEDLLQMAKLLKESSLTFGVHLESEKGYLDAAKVGLDRNAAGLTTAGSNMDSLRKNDNISFIWSSIYMAVIVILVSGTMGARGVQMLIGRTLGVFDTVCSILCTEAAVVVVFSWSGIAGGTSLQNACRRGQFLEELESSRTTMSPSQS